MSSLVITALILGLVLLVVWTGVRWHRRARVTPAHRDGAKAKGGSPTDVPTDVRNASSTEAPSQAPNRTPTGHGRRRPEDRGGRPRVSSCSNAPPRTAESTREPGTPGRVRPPIALVCWKEADGWAVGVDVSGAGDSQDIAVEQGGRTLVPCTTSDQRWVVASLTASVEVRWLGAEGTESCRLAMAEPDGVLLFKLAGGNRATGTRVRERSRGLYLVIAPHAWRRDEESAGPPPISPEPTCIPGYEAHYFEIGEPKAWVIAMRRPDGTRFKLEAAATRYELIGHHIPDGDDDKGPLFGRRPPLIRAAKDFWAGIATIVVGQEGPGRNRWRTAFAPNVDREDQELPPEMGAHGAGWYFVRLYDRSGNLVDSTDFRFARPLENISVAPCCPLPATGGHEAVRVELRITEHCEIQPAEPASRWAEAVQHERAEHAHVLTIPPHPDADLTRWCLRSDRGAVEFSVTVERVWWTIAEEASPPVAWGCKRLSVQARAFAATSSLALWLRFPRRRWVEQLRVGFEESRARVFPVGARDRCPIPLREFCDSPEISARASGQPLAVWVEARGTTHRAEVVALERSPELKSSTGYGRKKTATARSDVFEGSARFTVNDATVDEYFLQAGAKARRFLQRLMESPVVRDEIAHLDVRVAVCGGRPGAGRQCYATTHALARALMRYRPGLRVALRRAGFGGAKVRRRKNRVLGGLERCKR